MSNQDITKFEFILTLENNIVIQRFFSVNGYNPAAKNSIDLHEIITEVCEEIAADLKDRTLEFMDKTHDYLLDIQISEERVIAKEENFILRIKLGDAVFISRIFPAHIYHPKARYTVDIRPKVKKILNDITEVLSLDEPNKTYLQYELR